MTRPEIERKFPRGCGVAVGIYRGTVIGYRNTPRSGAQLIVRTTDGRRRHFFPAAGAERLA